MTRAAFDMEAVPTMTKRSITGPESTMAGSGSSPQRRAKSHNLLAAHKSERARATDAGSARATTERANEAATPSTPLGDQLRQSARVIQYIYS